MNKEEKESVAHLEWLLDEGILTSEDEPFIETVLNLIQKQEKEISKLRIKNNNLLSKLRNRIKQVNKLTKYSNYKKEFSNLNRKIEKQEKIINAMKYRVVLTEEEHQMILKMLEKRFNKRYEDCVVEYFKKVVDEDVKD